MEGNRQKKLPKKKISMKKMIKDYVLITIACAVYSVAISMFLDPNSLAPGGVTGIAIILNRLIPVETGTLILLINIPILLLGAWKFGLRFSLSTIYSTVLISLFTNLLTNVKVVTSDPLLAALVGGSLSAIGIGWVFKAGATTGGTDIVAKLLKLKWPWLPIGKLVALPDTAVMLLVALTFGQLSAMLYGFIKLYTCSRAMDAVLYGVVDSRVAYIISDRWKELSGTLLRDQRRGVTLLQGQGAYTGAEKRVLMIAFKQKEIVDLKRRVYELDPEAFLIVCDARDVLGNGFSAYRREEI